ncbi:hypothetical protein SLW70_00910 [Flavobacterium sp. NG2]|uniref:hypothetical protein n=1 Tax=Flavobacterium sp. NG2 TaxID=3097547 RepID=UPI002A82C9C6|nr:hypothetical protein [Flavobacterium sp. NG2]WPR71720.1 hypothetical protein SLW70_00910 [Flavobacterium sp. NG2]
MNIVYSLFLLISVVVSAQQTASTVVKGNISSYSHELEGVYVVNSRTEKTVISNEKGDFVIPAEKGDTIVFAMFQYNRVTVILTDKHFGIDGLQVKMAPIINQLNEVVIKNYSHINAVSLGIIAADQRSYSPAERKLKSASDYDPSANAGSMAGGSVGLDPLINMFSGRTAMLKKELVVEKKEHYMIQLKNMFNEFHFVNKLNIPAIYVKGFMYYAVENVSFTKVMDTDNKISIEFLLAQLAEKYLKIIKEEK